MAVQAAWINDEHTILTITFQSPWNWTEFETAEADMLQMLDSVSHQVYLVLDIRKGGFPPLGAMERFKAVSDRNHANVGRVVFVAPKFMADFVGTMSKVLRRTFGDKWTAPPFEFVSSLEAAQSLLQQSQG